MRGMTRHCEWLERHKINEWEWIMNEMRKEDRAYMTSLEHCEGNVELESRLEEERSNFN